MLVELRVDHYVLIKALRFQPQSGFNIITGETGAGKSILIGALGLILGERADSRTVSGNEKKCVIEGVFDVSSLGLQSLFEQYDLDYQDEAIIRREILTSGKSRAFINDTPVQLTTLKEVGQRLVDIHSQHQSLLLGSQTFLFDWLDAVTGSGVLASTYRQTFNQLKEKEQQLQELRNEVNAELAERDYHQFLFNELEEAKLDGLNQTELDEEFEVLQNAEEIGEVIGGAVNGLREAEDSALDRMNVVLKQLQRLSTEGGELASISERLASTVYELEEVISDLSGFGEGAQPNPERLEEINGILSRLHNLQTKHRVSDLSALVQLRDDLSAKLSSGADRENELSQLEAQIAKLTQTCNELANELHQNRINNLSTLEMDVNADLASLGLVNAQLQLNLSITEELSVFGRSKFDMLFTSNVGSPLRPAHKVASGGELSRLMLILKTYLARNKNLPCIIFDEIDTGVSGEIALKMAEVMAQLSTKLQVISITHLPQIASKGDGHFYVYKEVKDDQTSTFIRELDHTDRITELAKMLSGDNPTEGAIANARELLN
ncbi:MAG: DNA repair protein RecN [Bacteroidia bacterium]|nr:DNA repair protein RecN [Bacteroidia bacterium]